jgi:hypothetical protein
MPTAFNRDRAGAHARPEGRHRSPRRASQPGTSGAPRAWLVASLAVGLLVAAAVWWWSMRPPPQLPDDPAVFKTTSALWTAVCSRDPQAVAACHQRLQGYRQAQRLPASAALRLERIIQRTHAADWETAARELYDFMLGQRRQGGPTAAQGHSHSPAGASPGRVKTPTRA